MTCLKGKYANRELNCSALVQGLRWSFAISVFGLAKANF